jgi:HEAT repeat protein
MSPTPDSVKQLFNSSDFGDRIRAINQMRGLEPEIAFEMLQVAAVDGNTRVRYAAISQLSSVGRHDLDRAFTILKHALLEDSEPDVQAAAADALGGLKLTAAFEDLKQVYETTGEWLVQFSIVASLGELGDPRAFELLQLALQSDNDLISTAAIGSLGELGDARALPLLLTYVDADDWQIRHRVVQALSNYDDPEAKAAIEQLSHDTAAAVAETAKHYLA